MKLQIDDNEVRRTLSLFRDRDDELFEIRLIPTGNSNAGQNWSGYFKDVDVALAELHKIFSSTYYDNKRINSSDLNCYFVLNEIDPGCYNREQHNCFKKGANATKDKDIVRRRWLFIDLDPNRTEGTSSTNEQVKTAQKKATEVYKYLKAQGFADPIYAFSGNGVHLLYRIDIDNSEESEAIFKNFFSTMSTFFSNDGIKVDVKNVNAARICKLYGTLAQKGADTEETPHRMSRIIQVPKDMQTIDPAYIKKIADVFKTEEREEDIKHKGYSWDSDYKPFDLDEWMQKYCTIPYQKETYQDGYKYILEHCPWNEDHRHKDAAVFLRHDGSFGFGCFHDSCADKHWHEFREFFEPDAYQKKFYGNYSQRNRDGFVKPLSEAKPIEEKNGDPLWLSLKEIDDMPNEDDCFVRSGLKEFDNHFCGLRKRGTTILSGYSGGSKSTLLSQICLNALNDGNNVGCFSGELHPRDFAKWFHLQAAGKMYAEKTDFPGYCNVSKKNMDAIDKWCEGKFWLYNNNYGFDYARMLKSIEEKIDRDKLDLICIDNLMVLDTASLALKDLDQQKVFAQSIHELAQKKNVHIVVVCHPKKSIGLLDMYDVLGSSNIVNLFDNIIFVYRVTQGFQNAYSDYYKAQYLDYCENNLIQPGTNCYHVAKARFGSVNDDYYSLFYEPETKRLKNDPAEYVHYGWEHELDEFT